MSRNSVFLSSGDRDLWVAFKVHLGSQALSQVGAKHSALLSSCDQYSWSPLSGLKEVKPPMELWEGTRDCSLGPAGKEGPHLVRTGESRGFSWVAARSLGFLSSYDGEIREPLVLPQGSPVCLRVARGSTGFFSSHSRGIGPQFALKGESWGLSRFVGGNFGIPRVATVTSGSFSWCLWEVRNPFTLWGASRDSSGVSAIEEGLISSWGRNLRFPLLFWHESRGVSAVSNRESGLDLCWGIELCFPLEL